MTPTLLTGQNMSAAADRAITMTSETFGVSLAIVCNQQGKGTSNVCDDRPD